ncbi:MAG TPA: hypothetical protein VLT34_18655, partial [Arthrobacter sp.]|nr:hypothetical protein [Arthrobacter sp.]
MTTRTAGRDFVRGSALTSRGQVPDGSALRASGIAAGAFRVVSSGAGHYILRVQRIVSSVVRARRSAFAIIPSGVSSGSRPGLLPHRSAFAIIPSGV